MSLHLVFRLSMSLLSIFVDCSLRWSFPAAVLGFKIKKRALGMREEMSG